MEDGVSDRASGVPYFINVTGTCACDENDDTISFPFTKTPFKKSIAMQDLVKLLEK